MRAQLLAMLLVEHCKLDNHVLNDREVCPIYDCLAMPIACRQGRCAERP